MNSLIILYWACSSVIAIGCEAILNDRLKLKDIVILILMGWLVWLFLLIVVVVDSDAMAKTVWRKHE